METDALINDQTDVGVNEARIGEANGESSQDTDSLVPTRRKHGDKTSSFIALLNFLKGNIGSGILSLPAAFKYAGLWVGFGLLLFYGIMSTYLMHVLLRTSESLIEKHELDRSSFDYTEAVFNVFKYGPVSLRKYKGKLKHTVNGFLLVTQIGFCCVYVLFISENIQYFIKAISSTVNPNLYLIGFLVTLFFIPVSQIKKMRVLGILSFLAIIATVIGLVLIFVYLISTGLMDANTLPAYKPLDETLVALGIFVYTFEGVSLTLPICNEMINPHKFVKLGGVLNTSMVIVVSLCGLIGFFGYLRFGEDTPSSITYTIPNWPLVYAFVKPLFILAIVVSYLLQFLIPAMIFARLMLKIKVYRDASPRTQSVCRKVMRTFLVLSTYGIAMAVPHVDLMVSLLGAVCSSMLALIIPPVLEVVHLWPDRGTISCFWFKVVFKHSILILVGLVSMLAGTAATVLQISRTFNT